MKNLKEPSGFFEKSTKALHREEEGLMVPTSNRYQFVVILIIFLQDMVV